MALVSNSFINSSLHYGVFKYKFKVYATALKQSSAHNITHDIYKYSFSLSITQTWNV